jgi:hypothetical protein
MRSNLLWMAVVSWVTRLWRAWASAVGMDELLLAVALVLLTAGAWPVLEWVALVIPGAVLLWVALPSRAPFVARGSAEPPDASRRTR